MSDQPEALAAILAEMRHRAENHHLYGWESVAEELEELCERIDAAAAREYAQWHGETNAAKEERNRIACKMRYEFAAKCRACKSAPCNAAAMRAVVERCRDYFADLLTLISPEDENRLLNECNAALAAPARNCDRFATAEDARDAVKSEFANTMLLDDRQLRAVCDWLFSPRKKETDNG